MKSRVITLDSNDVYKNIAQEYKYFLELKDEVILLLWQNSPSVIMGRNQNVYRELDLEYIKSTEINIARRFTGGGAVYHDLGNLNFTIISPQKYKDIELWMEIVQTALSKLHIPSER
ncbi:lipoate--protein ligase family protein, partial [Helcococcus kunzii]|uniref:lipoate--protein ligase family protein n=1 Tax=Helcococcus kunzii TaxID=40091 RepID=UPI003B00E152